MVIEVFGAMCRNRSGRFILVAFYDLLSKWPSLIVANFEWDSQVLQIFLIICLSISFLVFSFALSPLSPCRSLPPSLSHSLPSLSLSLSLLHTHFFMTLYQLGFFLRLPFSNYILCFNLDFFLRNLSGQR